jgi:SAM-dependent methyltransferase
VATKYTYSFRPRKQIQRLLIADVCQRLRAIAPLGSYEYIGFGGFEFIDFDIFRRRLGIHSMVSYEKDAAADRYEFNVPFADITLKFGAAALHLPFIDKAQLRIVWLDYTQRLDDEVIQDLATAASRLAPGSVLIASVNAVPGRPADTRRDQLVEDVGEERIPNGVTSDTLAKWGLAEIQRRIMLRVIADSLEARGEGAVFEQIFHFRYADGAQMLTVGGVIVTPGVRRAFESARFDEFEHVRRDEDAAEITAPPLTAKEALHLNRQLPLPVGVMLECPGLDKDDLEGYGRFYRWYPRIPAAL